MGTHTEQQTEGISCEFRAINSTFAERKKLKLSPANLVCSAWQKTKEKRIKSFTNSYFLAMTKKRGEQGTFTSF